MFKEFNDSYSNGIIAIIVLLGATIGWAYKNIYKESKRSSGDAASIVGPVFWTLGKKYKILAVHEFEKSKDISGYKDLGQNSRPDQWGKHIEIKSQFRLRHLVKQKNPRSILEVIISRNGKEKWRSITFNK